MSEAIRSPHEYLILMCTHNIYTLEIFLGVVATHHDGEDLLRELV